MWQTVDIFWIDLYIKFRFRATRVQSPYIKTRHLHPSQNQIDKNRKDGSCTFEINVCINYELYSIFMSYGSGVEILSPRKARDYMKAQFEEALKQYQKEEKWNELFSNKPIKVGFLMDRLDWYT